MSTNRTNRKKKVVSTLDADSPVDLYWLNRENDGSGPSQSRSTEGDKTIINEAFWDDFLIIAKAVYMRNKEADIFDVFNTIRERFLGGWTMLEDSKFIRDIDEQIDRECKKEQRNGR